MEEKSKRRATGRRTNEKPINILNLGARVPPHSTDAEVAVLGAMMLSREAISRAQGLLEADAFYHQPHKIIYEALLNMNDKGMSGDIISLKEYLKSREQLDFIGGIQYLADINSRTPTAANVENHSRIVQERYLKRCLIEASGQILANAYDESTDALEEIDKAESLVFEIAEKLMHKSYLNLNTLAFDAYKTIIDLSKKGSSGLSGIPTGYLELDLLLGGLQKSDLIIIAARPSMGKTAFALSVARNIAVEYNHPIAFFSLEMSALQLVIRLISAEAKVNQQKIRTGHISPEDNTKIIAAIGDLAKAPIFIDDTPGMTLMEFRAKARRLKAEQNIGMIVVDYLQLLHSPKAESREREISIISQSMKNIAKELDIPIVALAQLNRSVEGRSDKRPMLSDLRESGSIEQDADVVMFINRPEQYKQEKYDDGTPTENTAEIIIGKQRNGPVGTKRLAFIKDYARFENLAFEYEDSPIESNDFGDGPNF